MKLVLAEQAREDWQKTDKKQLERINTLIREICRSPSSAITTEAWFVRRHVNLAAVFVCRASGRGGQAIG